METPMIEQWKPVVGYEGLYEVSNTGNVRSYNRTVPCLRNGAWGTRTLQGQAIKPRVSKVGYPLVPLSKNHESRGKLVHLLVLEAFVSPRPNGMEARHLNGIRSDARLLNLAWGTKQENMADKNKHGTAQNGVRNGSVKLTEDQVLAIRGAAKGSVTRLCREIGIARSNAIKIRSGQAWAHLQGNVHAEQGAR